MYANVSSDVVVADEDTISVIPIDDSGLIFSAIPRHSNKLIVISYYWPALLLAFFSIIGIVGNTLVCLAIATERRLQNRTNWFLFSLALADMLVSGLVIPLAIVKEFTGSWILGPILCDLWLFLDVCSCTSSIMHIVVISIDRFLAINDPLNARNRQRKCKILCLILIVWLVAILLSSPIIILGILNEYNIIVNGHCLINNQFFVIYGSVVAFVIPLIIVIVMYTLTVRRLKEQIKRCQTQLAQEQLARAASLVAQPFLRRHLPTHAAASIAAAAAAAAAAATANNTPQSTPLSATAARRLRLQRQQTSLELSEESEDIVSLQQHEHESHNADKKQLAHNLERQTSTKFSPHAEYACPKNPFCQLKCTCRHHQQQQQQQPQNSPSRFNCFKRAHQYMTTAPSVQSQTSDVAPRPVVLPTPPQPSSLNSSRSRTGSVVRNWRRLTITPSLATSRSKSSAVRNEQKAVKVLGVVFVIFVIAWFPFCIMNLLQGVCKRCTINPLILNGFVWLGYVSSTINPLVYTIFNRNFRLKFIALLKCQCLCSQTRRRQLSYYHSHSSLHGSRFQPKNGLMINDIRRFNKFREQQELRTTTAIVSQKPSL